ncbi:unnamed protein product [Trichogramma brassicae]|uniref:Uncharacterized protein n=1 Tax=Trichogramma brassicae TaxID=86971 RepID=A0A6H5J306_9HYME|nr:unnamed protein product [Trichogramma brassicae]
MIFTICNARQTNESHRDFDSICHSWRTLPILRCLPKKSLNHFSPGLMLVQFSDSLYSVHNLFTQAASSRGYSITGLSTLFKILLDEKHLEVLEFLQQRTELNIHRIFIDGKSAIHYLFSLYYKYESDLRNDNHLIDPTLDDLKQERKSSKYHAYDDPETKFLINFFLKNSEENHCDDHGYSYLHGACFSGDIETVKRFVSQGADVNVDSYTCSPPLHIACKKSDTTSSKLYSLISDWDGPASESSWHPPGRRNRASSRGVCQFYRRPRVQLSRPDNHRVRGPQRLQGSARSRYRRRAAQVSHHTDSSRRQTLVRQHRNIVIRELFKIYDRFDVDYTDEFGYTHFHVACESGSADVVAKFLEAGQDPDCLVPGTEDRPLHLAPLGNSKQVVAALLRAGGNPNSTNVDGMTPLHMICKINDEYSLIDEFFTVGDELDQKIQVNAKDKLGNTPLHLAFMRLRSNETAAEYLLRRGADPNSINKDGLTALHVCLRKEDDSLAKTLIKICDEVGRKLLFDDGDEEGRTPLEVAVASLYPDLVDMLLDHGASLSCFVFPTFAHFAERLKLCRLHEDNSKLRLASGALCCVERLERRGYKLNRPTRRLDDHETIHQGKLSLSADLEQSWYDDAQFAVDAKKIMLKPDLSLCELVRLREEDVEKRLTYMDYFELAHSDRLCNFSVISRKACTLNLCEKLSRGFFRRYALDAFLELKGDHYPELSCERLLENLKNKDLHRPLQNQEAVSRLLLTLDPGSRTKLRDAEDIHQGKIVPVGGSGTVLVRRRTVRCRCEKNNAEARSVSLRAGPVTRRGGGKRRLTYMDYFEAKKRKNNSTVTRSYSWFARTFAQPLIDRSVIKLVLAMCKKKQKEKTSKLVPTTNATRCSTTRAEAASSSSTITSPQRRGGGGFRTRTIRDFEEFIAQKKPNWIRRLKKERYDVQQTVLVDQRLGRAASESSWHPPGRRNRASSRGVCQFYRRPRVQLSRPDNHRVSWSAAATGISPQTTPESFSSIAQTVYIESYDMECQFAAWKLHSSDDQLSRIGVDLLLRFEHRQSVDKLRHLFRANAPQNMVEIQAAEIAQVLRRSRLDGGETKFGIVPESRVLCVNGIGLALDFSFALMIAKFICDPYTVEQATQAGQIIVAAEPTDGIFQEQLDGFQRAVHTLSGLGERVQAIGRSDVHRPRGKVHAQGDRQEEKLEEEQRLLHACSSLFCNDGVLTWKAESYNDMACYWEEDADSRSKIAWQDIAAFDMDSWSKLLYSLPVPHAYI